jgi:5-hydroxyisourate hydrolase
MADERPTISTHVLDTARGEPARGITVRLSRLVDDGAEVSAGEGITDTDGRIRRLLDGELLAGDYRIAFDLSDTGGYFLTARFDIRIEDATRSHHVPLLLAPYGMTTYRGS